MGKTPLWTFLLVWPSVRYQPMAAQPCVPSGNQHSLSWSMWFQWSWRQPWCQGWSTWPGSKPISTSQCFVRNGTWHYWGSVYNSKTFAGISGRSCGLETWDYLKAEAADTVFLPHESWRWNRKMASNSNSWAPKPTFPLGFFQIICLRQFALSILFPTTESPNQYKQALVILLSSQTLDH